MRYRFILTPALACALSAVGACASAKPTVLACPPVLAVSGASTSLPEGWSNEFTAMAKLDGFATTAGAPSCAYSVGEGKSAIQVAQITIPAPPDMICSADKPHPGHFICVGHKPVTQGAHLRRDATSKIAAKKSKAANAAAQPAAVNAVSDEANPAKPADKDDADTTTGLRP